MRIVEQTRDRLVIEDRKTAPMWQPAFAVFVLTLPLLIAYLQAMSQPRSWRVLVIVGVIWATTAAIYAAVMRGTQRPRIELDANSGRAIIGGNDYPLAAISSVLTSAVSTTAGLTIMFREGQIFTTGRNPNEIQIFSASASTPAERSRTAKVINAFLETHRRPVSAEDPYRDVGGENYADPFAGEDEKDAVDEAESREEEHAPAWARAWDAESTDRKKCFYCGTGSGETAPLQLWAERGRFQLEIVFIPRCRRCRFTHGLNRRFLPASAVIAGQIAGVIVFMTRIVDAVASDVARIAGFLIVVIGTPVAAYWIARLITAPVLFGSKDRDAWKEIPDLQHALRNGWKLRVRRSTS